jgi:hypothetical protein
MKILVSKFAIISLMLLASITSMAQTAGVLEIYGMIKDESTKKKLEGAKVIVVKDGAQFDTYDPGSSGKYEISVPLGAIYDFKFVKQGYLTKIIRFDTKNIPAEDKSGGFQTDMDITLYVAPEGFSEDLTKEPFGIARFQAQENAIDFDFEYTEKQQQKYVAEFKRIEGGAKDDEKKKKDFETLVAAADKMVGETKYADGIQKYNEALTLFPNDSGVKKKKEDAQKKLDELNAGKELEAKYKKAIEDGEANIKSASYANARKNFEQAATLKPKETLPAKKLEEIAELEKNAESKKKYDAIIAEADKKFNSKDYSEAITKYKEAQPLMPKLTYPADQIKEAEKALAASDKDKKYNDLIAAADKDFKSKSYESCIGKYKEAQAVKPSEAYPGNQIDLANAAMKALKDSADAEAKKQEYDKLIVEADKLFKSKSYSECITKYEAASKIFADEPYPRTQITLARNSMSDAESAAKEAEKKKQYDELMADADKKFSAKDYALAIEKYEEAKSLMPGEQKPKDQIQKARTALDALLANEADKAKRQRDYDDKIKSAESSAADKNYEGAITLYKDAQRLKPEESLPGVKIKEIQDLIAQAKKQADAESKATANAENERAELEKRYDAKMKEADALFSKDELSSAKTKYQESLEIKPDASLPTSKIQRIDQMLADKEREALAAASKSDAEAKAKADAQAKADELARKKQELEAKAKADREAALRKQEEEREAKEKSNGTDASEWTSDANEQAERELEEYYRDARQLEEQARYKEIEYKKFRNDSLLRVSEENSAAKRSEQMEQLKELEASNMAYAEKGEERTRHRTNEVIQQKDENNSLRKNLVEDSSEKITANSEKAQQQKNSLDELTQKGKESNKKSAEENEKKKQNQQTTQSNYQTTAGNRIGDNKEKTYGQKQQQEAIKGNNRYQEAKSDQLAERKSDLNDQEKERIAKAEDTKANRQAHVDTQKEQVQELTQKGSEQQQENATNIQEKNEIAQKKLTDKRDASNEHIQQRKETIESKKEQKESISDGKDTNREARALAIENQKSTIELQTAEQKQKSEESRNSKNDKLHSQNRGEKKSPDDYLIIEGTESLPEGVTENSYKLGEKMVTERTVKIGNKIDKYRKVVSKTGTYYFKNGKSITEGTWKQETLRPKRS